MACDIHLRLERRFKGERKENSKFSFYGNRWIDCDITSWQHTWSDREYGMFALLANVRNYRNSKSLPLRGFPVDANDQTLNLYTLWVVTDEQYKEYEDTDIRCCSESNAYKWIKDGSSVESRSIGGRRHITHPDYHSPNWCTTQEMEDCIKKLFFDAEKGIWHGNYEEWLALLWAMKGYESTGEYECRAVYWFDN